MLFSISVLFMHCDKNNDNELDPDDETGDESLIIDCD